MNVLSHIPTPWMGHWERKEEGGGTWGSAVGHTCCWIFISPGLHQTSLKEVGTELPVQNEGVVTLKVWANKLLSNSQVCACFPSRLQREWVDGAGWRLCVWFAFSSPLKPLVCEPSPNKQRRRNWSRLQKAILFPQFGCFRKEKESREREKESNSVIHFLFYLLSPPAKDTNHDTTHLNYKHNSYFTVMSRHMATKTVKPDQFYSSKFSHTTFLHGS